MKKVGFIFTLILFANLAIAKVNNAVGAVSPLTSFELKEDIPLKEPMYTIFGSYEYERGIYFNADKFLTDSEALGEGKDSLFKGNALCRIAVSEESSVSIIPKGTIVNVGKRTDINDGYKDLYLTINFQPSPFAQGETADLRCYRFVHGLFRDHSSNISFDAAKRIIESKFINSKK